MTVEVLLMEGGRVNDHVQGGEHMVELKMLPILTMLLSWRAMWVEELQVRELDLEKASWMGTEERTAE